MDYFAALNAFVKAAELGSFSKVADDEQIKVSTVSRYIKHLESDVGAALFHRSTRRLHLTEAGTAFYERAARVLADLNEARATASELSARPQGLLRVSMPGVLGRRHLMPRLHGFMQTFPDIRVDATLTNSIVDLSETGTDVAIRICATADSSLHSRRLAWHHRVLVGSPAYLSHHGVPTTPDEVRSHQCLRFAFQSTSAWYFRPVGQPEGAWVEVPIHARMRANDSEALLAAAVSGMGLGLLPTWLVACDIAEGRLLRVLPDWVGHTTPGQELAIWAVYPPKKLVSSKVRAYVNYVADGFADQPDL
jgi:DNA-binding transcriptional LysR family regulator